MCPFTAKQSKEIELGNRKPCCLTAPMNAKVSASSRSDLLLVWYDRHGRDLPWRARAGETCDPYRVWVSEIMLQQTTVVTVGPYFEKFMRRWPTIEALAKSDLDQVLLEWAGLGYYSRARNLHRCAQKIVSDWQGRFPSCVEELKSLPGIGPYTAAAIAAIAFERQATVVDGNVERVMSRVFAIETPLPKSKREIGLIAEGLTPSMRPGDYAQAVMDLGATICTPRNPNCDDCPWDHDCQSRQSGQQEQYPVKQPKPAKPTRRADIFVAFQDRDQILIRQRQPKGLLGGLLELPSGAWEEIDPTSNWPNANPIGAPIEARWKAIDQIVKHTFTHFHLELRIWVADTDPNEIPGSGTFVTITDLGSYAFPTLMKKVIGRIERISAELD